MVDGPWASRLFLPTTEAFPTRKARGCKCLEQVSGLVVLSDVSACDELSL
jgi:hypothetical protein